MVNISIRSLLVSTDNVLGSVGERLSGRCEPIKQLKIILVQTEFCNGLFLTTDGL